MKTRHLLCCAALAATFTAPLLHGANAQQQAIPNPRIDFAEHWKAVKKSEDLRVTRRVTEQQFLKLAAEPGTVVLDARSGSRYRYRHIKGAVSLPFTEFTAENLAKVIPTRDTRVLIYCNNNFLGDSIAFAEKSAGASLNLSTFVNLTIYGYTNVWELGPLLDVKTTALPFEGTGVGQ